MGLCSGSCYSVMVRPLRVPASVCLEAHEGGALHIGSCVAVLKKGQMLDFLGFIATAVLMVLAVNAIITFMDVSQSAKLTLAGLAGLWIGIAAAAASAGMVAISKPFPVIGLFVAAPLVMAAIPTHGRRPAPPCSANRSP